MGVPIARIFGIEIRVQVGWIFVLALVAVLAVGQLRQVSPQLEELVAWLLGGVVALGFFASSVSHDLAHALVARRRGVDVRAIGVSFFGGATPLDPVSPNPGDDAVIAASGPLTSIGISGALFVVMVAAMALGADFGGIVGALAVLVLLNFVLGVVNLVPAYPLDGGRIVRDIAWHRSGSERTGWRAASRTGRLTGLVIIGVGIAYFVGSGEATGAMVAITGWFLVLSANSVRDRIRLDDLVGDHLVSDAMDETATTVTPGLTVDTFAAQLIDATAPMSVVPVVDGAAIVGILGASQIRRIRRSDWAKTRVEQVMARPPKVTFLAPTDTLKHGLERIFRANIDGLPVLENGQLLGMLSKRGVGRFLGEKSAKAEASPRSTGEGPPVDGPTLPPA